MEITDYCIYNFCFLSLSCSLYDTDTQKALTHAALFEREQGYDYNYSTCSRILTP